MATTCQAASATAISTSRTDMVIQAAISKGRRPMLSASRPAGRAKRVQATMLTTNA